MAEGERRRGRRELLPPRQAQRADILLSKGENMWSDRVNEIDEPPETSKSGFSLSLSNPKCEESLVSRGGGTSFVIQADALD